MGIVSVALIMTSGICLGNGLVHLFLGLRQEGFDKTSLAFALFAIFYAGTTLGSMVRFNTTTYEAYLFNFSWHFLCVSLTFIFLLLFVAHYTGIRPRLFLAVMAAVFLFIAYRLPHEISGIYLNTLPWGEEIMMPAASGNTWLIFWLTQPIVGAFILYASIQQYRRGERWEALALGLGLLFLSIAIIFDIFVDRGAIRFFYTSDFGFLPLAIVMSLVLANKIIQTREELDRYRLKLQGLVDERTADLQRVNAQLYQSERTARALLNAPPDSALLIDPQGIILDINQTAAERLGLSPPLAPGTSIYDLWEPDVAALRRARVEEVAATRQPVRWQDVRGDMYMDNSLYPVLDADSRVVSIAVFAADITEHKQAGEALRQRIEELATLRRIAHKLDSSSDLDSALEGVSETIAYLFDAYYVHILLVGDKAGDLVSLIGFERSATPLARARVDERLSQLPPFQQVLRQGQPLVVSEFQSLPLSPSVRELLTGRGVQSLMLVPLLVRGSAIGLLAIATDYAERLFSADELSLAETIASDIAGTIESARLLERMQTTATAEERGRIARDLHDSVTQTLYSVSIVAEALPRLLERDVSAAKYQAAYLRQTVLGALAEMRTLLFELRPATLEKASLHVLLQQQADILTGRTRVPVDLVIEGKAVLLPTGVKIVLYRIAQEVLNNIARHAKASQVWATLHKGPDGVRLVIRDDGRGFDPASVTPEHMGLHIVRERAGKIGARFNIESEPGRGTQVTVEWTAARDGGRLGETNDA